MSKLDLTKPVQTRDGHKVEFIRDDLDDTFPVLGIITLPSGRLRAEKWRRDGSYFSGSGTSSLDLINVPEKRMTYVVIESDGTVYQTNSPSRYANEQDCSVVRIEYTVGQKDL